MSFWSEVTPMQYTGMYHTLAFPHPVTGATVNVEVTKYGSGYAADPGCNRADKEMATRAQNEFNANFTPALRKIHHGNTQTPCGSPFYFAKSGISTIIEGDEPFYAPAFNRTFNGKGSPDEITDTLRIALLTGRIGTGPDALGRQPAASTAQGYADLMVSLDCNALAGNYYGVDPNTSIDSYAKTTRRRTKLNEVRSGDALVTIHNGRYEHMAVVHWAQPMSDGNSTSGYLWCAIVEWGWYGDFSVHYKVLGGVGGAFSGIQVGPGKYGDYGLCIPSTSSDDVSERYFFGPPNPVFKTRGWGLGANSNA